MSLGIPHTEGVESPPEDQCATELPAQPQKRSRRAKGTLDERSAQNARGSAVDAHCGTRMSVRERVWEFVVESLSWIVAFGALVFVVAYVVFDAIQTRRAKARR